MECFEAGETERAGTLASALEQTPATRHFAFYLQSLIASRRGDAALALARIQAAEAESVPSRCTGCARPS